jgi:hypothetical protein
MDSATFRETSMVAFNIIVLILAVLSPVFGTLWIRTYLAKRKLEQRFQPILDLETEKLRLIDEIDRTRSKATLDLEADRLRLSTDIDRARSEASRLQGDVARLTAEHQALEEETVLRSFGFYKPVYDFSSSDKYEQRLEAIRERQKQMLKDKTAATCRIEWQVNGSKAEGRKQINQTLKLTLRAFNGECDASIAKVNYKNVKAMEARIEKAAETINSLVEIQQCFIATEYVNLKLDELHLAHEYQEKLQAEKDEQKRIREQMREEEVARRELERAKLEAEREERRYEEALRKAREEVLRTEGVQQEKLAAKITELEQKLADVQEKERAISQAQLTKAGHVYVISNIGSFGENVFKIGMTRRLVPQDRIDELGDASVPFEFDVHAIISTQDAPALENALHAMFEVGRLNRVNERKEFFRVSLDEIEAAVRAHHGEFEVTRVAEAVDYRKTLAILEDEKRAAEVSKSVAPTLRAIA